MVHGIFLIEMGAFMALKRYHKGAEVGQFTESTHRPNPFSKTQTLSGL